MLWVVVFNKGVLSELVIEIFVEVGYCCCIDFKDLIVIDLVNNVEFFFLWFKDIVIYVGLGEFDFGIIGCDLVCDFGV